MIEVNLPNIITIAICGMLGYALLIGGMKLSQGLNGAKVG